MPGTSRDDAYPYTQTHTYVRTCMHTVPTACPYRRRGRTLLPCAKNLPFSSLPAQLPFPEPPVEQGSERWEDEEEFWGVSWMIWDDSSPPVDAGRSMYGPFSLRTVAG
jgi:hypothetical protein